MSDTSQKDGRVSIPAPANRSELMAQRRNLFHDKVLNDYVEEAFVTLYDPDEHPRFVQLLAAVYDSETVEGALAADDYAAARYMRDYAAQHGLPKVAAAKDHTIKLSMGVIMRRYRMSRRERRGRVGDEQVELNLKGEE